MATLHSNKYSSYHYQPKSAGAIAKRLCFFAWGIFVSAALCFIINTAQFSLENYMYAQISQPMQKTAITLPAVNKPNLNLNVKAAYSLKIGESGREKIIYRYNYDEIYPIASLTKLMTAIVVLEHPEIYNLERQITVSKLAAEQSDVPLYGNLKLGEVLSVNDLLHWMLFYSSNDAAWALSEVMGEQKFVEAMNAKSRELGFLHTEYYNPNGLDREDGLVNHSSAAEITNLTKYIIQNHPEIFNYTIQPGPYLTENGIFNLNFWNGNNLIGGKTGFTEKAGGCMVVLFKDDNNYQYINVVLGSTDSEDRVAQMQKLINYVNNADKSLVQIK